MKEYSLQEIFDLPEGTEFINADAHFEVMNGVLYSWFKPKDKQSVRLTKMYVNMKFMKVEQPVSFQEVIDKDTGLCRVEHEHMDSWLRYQSLQKSKDYLEFNQLMELLSELPSDELKIVLKYGRWYLKESEVDEQ